MKTITLSRPLNTTHKRKNVFLRYIEACKNKKVYIATDPDREGYAIGYHFYEKIKK
ncbi:hypothetical protein VN0860_12430 [Helicobacter pylori]